jgi:hypothetical protein
MYVHAGIWLCMQHGNIDLSKEHCENRHPRLSSTIAINESDVLQWTLWSNTFWVCAQYSYKYRWYIIIKAKHCRQLYTTLVEQELYFHVAYKVRCLHVHTYQLNHLWIWRHPTLGGSIVYVVCVCLRVVVCNTCCVVFLFICLFSA